MRERKRSGASRGEQRDREKLEKGQVYRRFKSADDDFFSGKSTPDVPDEKIDPTGEGKVQKQEIPLRRAMNAVLLDAYIADCKRIVDRWNRDLEKVGVQERVYLPDHKFNRHQGIYSGFRFTPSGELIDEATWTHKHTDWLPTQQDRDYVRSCMVKVHTPGKFANYIAPPQQGANNQPIDFEYVKFH